MDEAPDIYIQNMKCVYISCQCMFGFFPEQWQSVVTVSHWCTDCWEWGLLLVVGWLACVDLSAGRTQKAFLPIP